MQRRCKKSRKSVKKTTPLPVPVKAVSPTESFIEESSEGYNWEQLHEYFSDTLFEVQPSLSRTFLALLDYRQFKAARTIQCLVRGWLVRHRLAKEHRAAIILQREWRRFSACRFCFFYLENKLQCAVEAHYNRCAIRIQALWRGWWVREHIHNHGRLGRMQLYAAEDLLFCVAFKLHHLLRTRQIPGIYSIRNSNCLSKVEQLLAAMSFKQYNRRARVVHSKRDRMINEAKKDFLNSTHQTKIPYTGPNISAMCEPKCCDLYRSKDADRRMHRILQIYAETVCMQVTKNANDRPRKNKSKTSTPHCKRTNYWDEKEGNFCVDIIKSMKRWNILCEKESNIDPDVIIKQPANVENFLREAQSLYSLMQDNCACSYQTIPAMPKPPRKRMPCP